MSDFNFTQSRNDELSNQKYDYSKSLREGAYQNCSEILQFSEMDTGNDALKNSGYTKSIFVMEMQHVNDICSNDVQSKHFEDESNIIENINLQSTYFHSDQSPKKIESKSENEILKDLIKNNNDKLKSMDEDIKLLKIENQSLTHMMDHWRIMLENKLDAMNSEMRATIQEIRQEIEMKINKNKSLTNGENFPSKTENESKQLLEKKIAGIYVWNIDRVMERRKKRGAIWSEYFYTRNNHYKMRLQFHPNGFVCTGTGLSIYLFLYPSETNSKLTWPFKADATIKIINKANPSKSKIITKYCHVDKPVINPYKCCASFDFIYQDLYIDGLFQDDYFSVECFVNVK